MKKLLILGGSRYIIPVIEAARNLGVYVITADYLPNNIAHRFSDRYENISVVDKEKVLKFATKEHIDGISAFACDAAVVTAAYVAEKMSLPSPGPLESIEILQNKGRFRKLLSENHFNVPFFSSATSYKEAQRIIDQFGYPIIVKPTDSCGSKGVTRVDSLDGLKNAVENAMNHSFTGECIIESYIEQKGYASDSDAFSIDGKLNTITFSSQRFDKKAANPYTPSGFSWPSSISISHQKELTSEIQRLLSLLSMGTSIYNIEAREGTDGKAYIMEVSPRGGGNRLAECIRYATGIDMIENSVRAALGMVLLPSRECNYNGNWAEVVLHSGRSGFFRGIEIDHDIESYIIEKDVWVEKGDTINTFTGANQSIGTIIFKFKTQEQAANVLENVGEYIRIIVD